MREVGQKLYTIEARNVVEYTITQKVTTETMEGVNEEFFIKNKGTFRQASVKLLSGEFFSDKKEAQGVLDLVNKYA